MKVLRIYTDNAEIQPPLLCQEITDEHWNSEDYPLDKYSKDEERLHHEVIHVYGATRIEVMAHLQERGGKIFSDDQVDEAGHNKGVII